MNLYATSKISTKLNQQNLTKTKGCTVWFTGLSASGKTTISFELEKTLQDFGIVSYSLDGDNIRSGINNDLNFSPKDRTENIRRVGEVSKLFTDAGLICLSSFISPYKKDRDFVKKIHKESNLRFIEIFVNTPIEICKERDPKGLYKKAIEGIIPEFTGISAPYEKPEKADLELDTSVLSIKECVVKILDVLYREKIIEKKDEITELFMTENERKIFNTKTGIKTLEITELDTQWLQILSEGWASPLTGYMKEDEYLSCTHYGFIVKNGQKYNQTVPIVLSISENKKRELERESEILLVYKGKKIAIISELEIYKHRKEERCSRIWGTNNDEHPHIKMIHASKDFLIGGNIKVFERILWNDGLDKYRLTPLEIREEIKKIDSDCVYAFQLRNPIHNGHALLMKDTKQRLLNNGFKKPVLLLHPLGGWTKDDDVPLGVRMKQYKVVLEENVLEKDSTILAIFPSPMLYAGPVEVQWHAKTRMLSGATHYIVGRDPAGISHPDGGDLYDHDHGKKILSISPHLPINIIPFKVAAYNKLEKKMDFVSDENKGDFEFISGTRIRNLARNGESPPEGFMNNKAWRVLEEFYNQ
jgi:3'-phosphoadenosine 5'-phosphosulfate synthase